MRVSFAELERRRLEPIADVPHRRLRFEWRRALRDLLSHKPRVRDPPICLPVMLQYIYLTLSVTAISSLAFAAMLFICIVTVCLLCILTGAVGISMMRVA